MEKAEGTLDYRVQLKGALLEKKRQFGQVYTFQRMSKACGVQKTYLSRVLSGRGHLNGDQLYLASRYLKFSETEREHLFLLYEYERSEQAGRRAETLERIRKIHEQQNRSDKYLTVDRLAETQARDISEYYLDPYLQLVHIFLTIESYAQDVGAIARRLGLQPVRFAGLLEKLQHLGIISESGSRYRVEKDNLHLSPDSAAYGPWRTLVRTSLLGRVQNLGKDASYNFSAVFSANEDARQKIQKKFLQFLSEAQRIAGKAPSEAVYQIHFDLVSW